MADNFGMALSFYTHEDVLTIAWTEVEPDVPYVPMVVHEARDGSGTVVMRYEYPVGLREEPSLPKVGRGTSWVRVSY